MLEYNENDMATAELARYFNGKPDAIDERICGLREWVFDVFDGEDINDAEALAVNLNMLQYQLLTDEEYAAFRYDNELTECYDDYSLREADGSLSYYFNMDATYGYIVYDA